MSESSSPDSWSRRSSLRPEQVASSLDLGFDLQILDFIFCCMEVEEAKEEMIEVEAARLILEGETRCLIRPLISSRTA